MSEPTLPPTGGPLATVLSRLGEAFVSVSALTDAVDALPAEQVAQLRPSTSAAYGALTEAEHVAQLLAATS